MGSDEGYGCWKPYASSLDFKKLNFQRLKGVVELNQIGMAHRGRGTDGKISRSLYAHYERPMSASSERMIFGAKDIARSIGAEQAMGFEVVAANSSVLPGTPPSSYWSVLNGDVDGGSTAIPGVVLTDHPEEYGNKWYHSVYDSYYNDLNVEQICMVSQFGDVLNVHFAANRERECDCECAVAVFCALNRRPLCTRVYYTKCLCATPQITTRALCR